MKNVLQIFKDKKKQDDLFEKGYVVIPFLNKEELDKLRDFEAEVHQEGLSGLMNHVHMTTWSTDKSYKEKVRQGLKEIFAEANERAFEQYRSLNHVFIIKESDSNSEFYIHQDWNVVDEKESFSFNVWVPLYDTTKENGALYILPNSHKIENTVRGGGVIFPDYGHLLTELKDEYIVNTKAGEALVFFHSTIHGSHPNVSGKNRIVAAHSIVPQDSALRIYFQKSNDAPLEVYEPSDDFVYEYENIREESMLRPPKGKKIS